jgi:hydrogenase maturation factor
MSVGKQGEPDSAGEQVRLRPGKLPAALLRELLAELPAPDQRLLIGPGIGEDAAVISFGSTDLIAKSDPVTFATDLIGWYAVHVNANDIAATGGTPRWFLPTVFLPEGESEHTARQIFRQLKEAASGIGVTLAGGHTEITSAVTRPVVAGSMLGEVSHGRAVSTSGAMPGDDLILTKGIAIEGTAILARELAAELGERGVSREALDKAAKLLFSPGISVLSDAQTAIGAGGVTAMHDPTEGGLATALAELAEASNVGLTVYEDTVTVLPESRLICDALGVDPWGLISSGALLIACGPGSSAGIVGALRASGVSATVIGTAEAPVHGLRLVSGRTGKLAPLPVFERDEIARVFES